MSEPETRSVLARIVAAHLGVGPGQSELVPGLQVGLTRAIRRAALPFAALSPQVAVVNVTCDANLTEAITALPDNGLLAAIEDEEGRRGLIALDHSLVDALIEVQATGHVEDGDLPPRAVTRIDEALCRDFLDLMFGAFAQETAEIVSRDWSDRMSYGSCIKDRAQLNLLLPNRGYHLMKASVTMGGRKTGDLLVLLPSDHALARRRALAAPQAEAAPVDWSKKMLSVLGSAPMSLDAVLIRVTMPLGEVEALDEGELVPFDRSDLSTVTLEDDSGHVFARGSLGQLSGRRAVRLGTPNAASNSAAKSAAPAQPMSPDATPPMVNPGVGLSQTGGSKPNVPMAVPETAGLSRTGLPDLPMGDFDPNAPMGGFDPNAPMG